MLKRIRIKGYKSLVDLELKLEALTVLVGPNASGKKQFPFIAMDLQRLIQSDRSIRRFITQLQQRFNIHN